MIRRPPRSTPFPTRRSSDLIAKQKGTPTKPGVNSPYRDRPIEESLEIGRAHV